MRTMSFKGLLISYISSKCNKKEKKTDFHSESKLSFAYESYKAEHERRRRIETKAAALITTISVVATLITAGVVRLFLNRYEYGTFAFSLMITLFAMSVTLGISCYYAVKALRPQKCEYIAIEEFKDFDDSNDSNYYEEFIELLSKHIEHNINIGQAKSLDLDKAINWFRWSVIILVLYSALLSVYYILDMMGDFINRLSNRFIALGTDTLVTYTTVLVLTASLVAVVLSIVALYKIHNLSNKKEIS